MQNQTIVNCPICDKPVPWTDEYVAKPFCSERCKLIDLGEWASDTRAIPGEPTDPAFGPDKEAHF